MRKTIDNWGRWFLTCAVLGSIPGAACWAVFYAFGGTVGF